MDISFLAEYMQYRLVVNLVARILAILAVSVERAVPPYNNGVGLGVLLSFVKCEEIVGMKAVIEHTTERTTLEHLQFDSVDC